MATRKNSMVLGIQPHTCRFIARKQRESSRYSLFEAINFYYLIGIFDIDENFTIAVRSGVFRLAAKCYRFYHLAGNGVNNS